MVMSKVKELKSTIYVIENVLSDEFIKQMLSIRTHSSRIDLISFPAVLSYFKKYWFENIEPLVSDYFFSVFDVKNGVGLNMSEKVLNDIKNYSRTKFRNIYTLRYTPENSQHEPKNVHIDFDNFTYVGCLNDNFDGGELNFPLQEFNVKIKKGDVVFFLGGITHPHFVNAVSAGIRDVFVVQTLPYEHNHNDFQNLNQ